ncbi:hypothetical protein [Bradyrhizobium barranii]
MSDPEATDIDRRAQDVVKFGKIKEVDYKRQPPAYRVLIGDENDEDNHNITDWLPAGGMRAKGDRETHFLEKGEKVVLLAEGGELATAQVYPAGTYTPENEDEKETTDKAGVWRKIFAKPKSNDGQGGEGGEDGGEGGEDGQDGEEDEILGEISYDRSTGDWLIKGLKDKGTITIEGTGCSIVMKEGTITLQGEEPEDRDGRERRDRGGRHDQDEDRAGAPRVRHLCGRRRDVAGPRRYQRAPAGSRRSRQRHPDPEDLRQEGLI